MNNRNPETDRLRRERDAALLALRQIKLPDVAHPLDSESPWSAITIELSADAYRAIKMVLHAADHGTMHGEGA